MEQKLDDIIRNIAEYLDFQLKYYNTSSFFKQVPHLIQLYNSVIQENAATLSQVCNNLSDVMWS